MPDQIQSKSMKIGSSVNIDILFDVIILLEIENF